MTRPLVVITRRLVPEVLDLLQPTCTLRVHDRETPMPRRDLLATVTGCDAIISTLADVIDGELMDAAGARLAVVANHAVGYHNIDLPACSSRGVTATNTPDVLTDATADHAWALLLAAARRVGEGDRWIRSGTPWAWAPTFLLGQELRGATLGVIGLGRIGRAVARRATGFGMHIGYHNRTPLPIHETDAIPARYRTLEQLIRESDVICLCCPLTPRTYHLIDADVLSRMKTTAILVNVAAGGIVDEFALADALDSGEIFAAALDGYDDEPNVPARLRSHERVVLTPHLGSATLHTRRNMGLLAARNVLAVLDGSPPLTPIPGSA